MAKGPVPSNGFFVAPSINLAYITQNVFILVRLGFKKYVIPCKITYEITTALRVYFDIVFSPVAQGQLKHALRNVRFSFEVL